MSFTASELKAVNRLFSQLTDLHGLYLEAKNGIARGDEIVAAQAAAEAAQEDADTANAAIAALSTPALRIVLGADSTLTADAIGAATEAIHTALALAGLTARASVKFFARLIVLSDNAADTWTVRLRLGGLGGALIGDLGALNIAANQMITLEGSIQIRTTGAGGTFDAHVRLWDPVAAEMQQDSVIGGAVNTTAAVSLVVTGECSSANADNQVSLREFWAEVWDAA